jgi:hypothetical protein
MSKERRKVRRKGMKIYVLTTSMRKDHPFSQTTSFSSLERAKEAANFQLQCDSEGTSIEWTAVHKDTGEVSYYDAAGDHEDWVYIYVTELNTKF